MSQQKDHDRIPAGQKTSELAVTDKIQIAKSKVMKWLCQSKTCWFI